MKKEGNGLGLAIKSQIQQYKDSDITYSQYIMIFCSNK